MIISSMCLKNKGLMTGIVFGVVSVPWTYFFERVLLIPLWPSFIASASFFAAGGGFRNLTRSYLANISGIIYALFTLLISDLIFRNDIIWLSIFVGIFMFGASMHYVSGLFFLPGMFFGYAAMFSVNAVDAGIIGYFGAGAQAVAAAISMLIGAVIGFIVEKIASFITGRAVKYGNKA